MPALLFSFASWPMLGLGAAAVLVGAPEADAAAAQRFPKASPPPFFAPAAPPAAADGASGLDRPGDSGAMLDMPLAPGGAALTDW